MTAFHMDIHMVATLVLHYPYEFVSPCSSAQVHHALDIFYMDLHFDVYGDRYVLHARAARAVLHRANRSLGA